MGDSQNPACFCWTLKLGSVFCVPCLSAAELGFPIPLQKNTSKQLTASAEILPAWVRLEQKAGEGLANSIQKYIPPTCISGTRPFSEVKLLKPSSHLSSEDKFPFLPLVTSWLAKATGFWGQGHSLCRDVCAVAVDRR